jgi:hypothetical protein
VTVVVQQHEIPERIRDCSTMVSDYVDLFTATASRAMDTSPEQWARAALEGASPVGRFLAWQVLLGLRLDQRPSPDHLAGWRIAERGDGWIRIEASSWFMTGHIVFQVEGDRVSFATFIRYDRLVAALVWLPASIIHRAKVPDVLRHAVRRVERSRR